MIRKDPNESMDMMPIMGRMAPKNLSPLVEKSASSKSCGMPRLSKEEMFPLDTAVRSMA